MIRERLTSIIFLWVLLLPAIAVALETPAKTSPSPLPALNKEAATPGEPKEIAALNQASLNCPKAEQANLYVGLGAKKRIAQDQFEHIALGCIAFSKTESLLGPDSTKALDDAIAYLLKLDNVTIYTFLFPLDGLHPDASKKAKLIWCSTDKSAAWRDYMLHDKSPATGKRCDSPIDRNVQLGQKLNFNGTPTLVAADGRVLPGAAPIEQIEKWLVGKGGN